MKRKFMVGAKRVLVVGSAEQSGGGVASVIKLMKSMPAWEKFHCHWLGTQIQRNYAWKLWFALKANFQALFIIWKYDIVHFHTVPDRICLIIQLPVFLLALISCKKIIMHIHMGNQLIHHTNNTLFKWCLSRANLIILLAHKWEKLFLKNFPAIKTPTTVLYNVCEIIPEVPLCEKENIIIMAAYFNKNKAPDVLLKAWQTIRKKYPDWQLMMLGNGEVDRYKHMSEEMGLTDSVHFTGYLSGEQKEDYFRKASIYCMCSYEEGFPVVVLEAWSYGICVVTTPVGGLPDVIEDERNVLVFDFGNWKQLASKLSLLIDDKAKRIELCIQARKMLENKFSVESVNRQVEKIYSNLQ